eukprot:5879458-Pyramimonas_sp.AAC.1
MHGGEIVPCRCLAGSIFPAPLLLSSRRPISTALKSCPIATLAFYLGSAFSPSSCELPFVTGAGRNFEPPLLDDSDFVEELGGVLVALASCTLFPSGKASF